MATYTQSLMDLGSQVCTRRNPRCDACPVAESCEARRLGLQHVLPEPRPRRTVPERRCAMLLLHAQRHVLLEKQPETGLWGGLWSLPRFETSEELAAACISQGIPVSETGRMASFVHTFTHFRLHIEPWRVEAPQRMSEPNTGQIWIPYERLADTAVPAPVRGLLDALPG